MNTVGERLKEERLRLGLGQVEFAKIGGCGRTTQFKYEANESKPDIEYLQKISEAGVDVLFLMTGERIQERPKPSPEQFEELLNYCVDILYEVQKELGITLNAESYKNALGFAFTSKANKAQMLKFLSAVVAMNK